MPTTTDLINRIRIKINDTSAFEFQYEEILSYINEGLSNLELLFLSNKVPFNISLLSSSSNICPIPANLLEIHKVIYQGKNIPLKNSYDFHYGYYLIDNNIILPENSADIYYIKEFDRFSSGDGETGGDNINMPYIYIDYLYNFAVIKALSRLEYNMDKEIQELSGLASMLVKHAMHIGGVYKIERRSYRM